jgi:hypothetical protein
LLEKAHKTAKTVDIFISNLEEDETNFGTANDSDGSLSKPFVDIMNGIEKGRELIASYSEGEIDIHLYKGTHFALWNYSQYIPSFKDLHSNNIKISIK